MKKNYLWISLCCFLALSLQAQEGAEDSRALVYSVSGKAKYSPEAKGWFNYQNLEPGTRLSPDGRLKIRSGAQVSLLHNEEFATYSGKKKATVEELLSDARAFQDDDYLTAFTNRLNYSENDYFHEPAVLGFVSTNGGRSGTESTSTKPPSRPTREGHQDPSSAFIPVSPNNLSIKPAKTSDGGTTFFWVPRKTAAEAAKNFTLSILGEDDKVVWEKEVQGNTHTVDLAEVGLQPGNYYKWRASLAGDAGQNTSAVPFQYVAESEAEAIMENLQSSSFYTSASPDVRLLIEGAAFEDGGMQGMAYDRYREAVRRYPRNEMAAAILSSFLYEYEGINP